jgi:uncharacterized protein
MGDFEKIYISANDLYKDSFKLGMNIIRSGYKPDHIVALWRGGTPVGMVIQEVFQTKLHVCNHLASKAKSYTGIGEHGDVKVPYIATFLADLVVGQKVLIVDDVFDTGRTAARMMELLQRHGVEVKIATLYWKPNKNETQIEPHYYQHSTEAWIVFPHELEGLTAQEVAQKDPDLPEILELHEKIEQTTQ